MVPMMAGHAAIAVKSPKTIMLRLIRDLDGDNRHL